MQLKITISILVFFWFTQCSIGQSYIGISQMTGKIFKHSSKILIEVPQTVWGLELHYSKKLNRMTGWQKFWGNPILDISASYADFNNKDQLGYAMGLSANLKFEFFKRRKVQFFLKSGTGAAFISKRYDPIANPENLFISTKINNMSLWSFGPSIRLNQKWKLEIGIALTHYSNGGTQKPNKGINLYRSLIGLHYQIEKNGVQEIQSALDEQEADFKKWGWMAQSSIGKAQIEPFYDKHFAVYAFSLFNVLKPNPYQSWLVGLTFENNQATEWYVTNIYKEGEEPRDAALNLSLDLGHQLEFGNIISRYMMGFYFEKAKWERDAPFFFRLQTEYRHKIAEHHLGFGISIKAHYFRAENISLFTSFYW